MTPEENGDELPPFEMPVPDIAKMRRYLNRRDNLEDWVKVERAAQFLGVTEAALRQMVCRGQVKYAKLGNRNRFRLSELEATMKRGRSGPPGEAQDSGKEANDE